MRNRIGVPLATLLLTAGLSYGQQAQPPAPPSELIAKDRPLDDGRKIDVEFNFSSDDDRDAEINPVAYYKLSRSAEDNGLYEELPPVVPTNADYERGTVRYTVEGNDRKREYYFRVAAVGPDGAASDFVQTETGVTPTRALVDGDRLWFGAIMLVLCGSVVTFIGLARKGWPLRVRRIAGLEAVDEAVGRATEMGRSILFIPGIQDMNDIQTVAGITILSRVARVAAEYDAKVEVPNIRALVMTTARETVQSAFLSAGRPDAYNEDDIYYVTDEQFGYVAYLSGMMVREKPAACFYMGSFYAESLILAETGNQIGAIQVAGTAMPSQLPFFVAACDYTLIGEEFFAASAYLSGEPDQLGSLKGQDVGKLIVAGLLIIGCALATVAAFVEIPAVDKASDYLQTVILK